MFLPRITQCPLDVHTKGCEFNHSGKNIDKNAWVESLLEILQLVHIKEN